MHETFLQVICEAPDDDTPRLVYADWLDEHGQTERAEFIRTQIQMTHLAPGSRRFAALRRRTRDLLAAHGEAWRQDLPKWVRRRCEFQRGFVTHVTCTALQFIKHGEALMRAAPVRSVGIRRGAGRIAALAESPHLAGLTALDLRSNSANDAGIEALAASPHLRHLTTLRLGNNFIGSAGMRALAAAPWLARLSVLDFLWMHMQAAVLRVFLASPYLPRPLVLVLAYNHLSNDGAELLAASPLLEQVVNLDLRSNSIGPHGMQALAASPYLACVRKLALSWNLFGDTGARALLASPHLSQLRRLSVHDCNIKSAKDALRQRFGSRVYL